MLDKYNEGLIISTLVCLVHCLETFWKNRDKSPDHVLSAMRDTIAQFKEIFGDRFYGEIQWNDIPEQHLGNNYIIQACMEMGVEVISTADSTTHDQNFGKSERCTSASAGAARSQRGLRAAMVFPTRLMRSATNSTRRMATRCGRVTRVTLPSIAQSTTILLSVTQLSAHITLPLTAVKTSFLTAPSTPRVRGARRQDSHPGSDL